MRKRRKVQLAAGVLGLFLAGCTINSEPKDPSSPEERSATKDAKEEQVTVYVEGMTKVQGIT